MTLDTACSSQLVATHLAFHDVAGSECTDAVSLGIGLLGPIWNEAFAAQNMTSLHGRCHTFDARADGYGRGEGCVALLCSAKIISEILFI